MPLVVGECMSDLLPILFATLLVSLISLTGVLFLSLNDKILNSLLLVLVAFASGALLGGAFLDLLPESLASGSEEVFIFVLLGITIFFVIEKFLRWRHCHDGKCDIHAFTYLNLIGDGIHNWIDGMIIAASFLTSTELGVVTTFAIAAHEIPQEIGDFGLLVYGGFKKTKALFYNFASALTAILGAVFTYYFAQHTENLATLLLPLAAGGFIYIAATDLLPEMHKREKMKDSIVQLIVLSLGIMLIWSLKVIFE
ncbi:MAG: ZIP family metal transporter [archaeon]|nr:ZIP family metal transporter [archaeon]MCP8322436.1 ZIP family metal transporter [archaeon]